MSHPVQVAIFLSTPSARRATLAGLQYLWDKLFLSTPSARRATPQRRSVPVQLGISIHALREEGDRRKCCFKCVSGISIHALREEGDSRAARRPCRLSDFYPRPPRGGRLLLFSFQKGDKEFLSTPSARRAT